MFLSASASAQGVCLCKPCATGCLQVVYAERNDSKSLVKGANSPLKAVIPTLMEIVFSRVSEKTGAERRSGGEGDLKRKEENNVR